MEKPDSETGNIKAKNPEIRKVKIREPTNEIQNLKGEKPDSETGNIKVKNPEIKN